MNNSAFVSIPRASDPALPEFAITSKGDGDRIAAYALLFIFSVCAHAIWTALRGRYRPSDQKTPIGRAVWYNHLDPLLGLDVMYMCARGFARGRLLETTRSFVAEVKTVSYLFLGKQAVLTIDPINLKALLAGRFEDFGLGSKRMKRLSRLFGNSIFNSEGESWKYQRAMLRPLLSRVRDVELRTFETHVQHLIDAIPKDGATFDIQSLFTSLTLDLSTDVFLGESTNLLSSKKNNRTDGQQFAKALEYAPRSLAGLDDYNLFNTTRNWLFGDRQLEESLAYMHKFVDGVLDRALHQRDTDTNQDAVQEDKESFVDALVRAGRLRSDLKYDIINVVMAGRETEAAFLASIWYVLSIRPDVYSKLRDEISILEGEAPTKEDLHRLPYLQKVLQEVLRLFPPLVLNQRTAGVDTVLPHGGGPDGQSPMRIPKGTSVGYSVYAMHRLPEFFGQDPDEFRPERWSDIRPQWAFMPFHAGPRMCLGQQFALAFAKYCTIRLIQQFPCLGDRNELPWEEKLGLNCFSKHGVNLSVVGDD